MEVVITGIGLVSPVGNRIGEFQQRLFSGASGIGPLTRFDATRFRSRLAGEVKDEIDLPREGPLAHTIQRMDRFVQYALSAAETALLDGGLDRMGTLPSSGGIFMGVGMGGLPNMERGVNRQETRGPRQTSPYLIPSLIPNMAASMIAASHNHRGLQYTIAGACAAGLQAIGQAMHSIRSGVYAWGLAGGVEAVVTPITFSGFEAMRALSRAHHAAPRPFDAQRDGMIVGEGAAIFLLETRELAEARAAPIHATVRGYGSCTGGGLAAQSAADTRSCMELALQDASLSPADVDCVFAQAAGMVKGDAAELEALKGLFGTPNGRPAITSIKGHIGHTFAASGPLNVAAAVGTLKEQTAPPTLHLERVDPEYVDMALAREPKSMRVEHCLVNAFGFGGINASLVLSHPLA